jgi:hypothetical protein
MRSFFHAHSLVFSKFELVCHEIFPRPTDVQLAAIRWANVRTIVFIVTQVLTVSTIKYFSQDANAHLNQNKHFIHAGVVYITIPASSLDKEIWLNDGHQIVNPRWKIGKRFRYHVHFKDEWRTYRILIPCTIDGEIIWKTSAFQSICDELGFIFRRLHVGNLWNFAHLDFNSIVKRFPRRLLYYIKLHCLQLAKVHINMKQRIKYNFHEVTRTNLD